MGQITIPLTGPTGNVLPSTVTSFALDNTYNVPIDVVINDVTKTLDGKTCTTVYADGPELTFLSLSPQRVPITVTLYYESSSIIRISTNHRQVLYHYSTGTLSRVPNLPTIRSTPCEGPQGPQGQGGPQGDRGPQGVQGVQGSQGAGGQGPQGFQGPQGTGAQGPGGPQGFQGTQGTQGPQGFQGDQGSQGFQGTQGTQGNQGDQGPQGFQGDQGFQGFQGTQGVQGPQGDQGYQGPSYPRQIQFEAGDYVLDLIAYTYGYFPVGYAATITGWTVIGDVAGDITIDIWKKNGSIPTIADTICGVGTKPYLSSEQMRSSTNLTGWTSTTILPGDVFAFDVTGPATLKHVTLLISVV